MSYVKTILKYICKQNSILNTAKEIHTGLTRINLRIQISRETQYTGWPHKNVPGPILGTSSF